MRDFSYEEDRDLEGFFDMEGHDSNEIIGMAQLDLLNINLHHQMLSTAIQVASKDWFWRLRSQEYKLKRIASIFRNFNKLIGDAVEN